MVSWHCLRRYKLRYNCGNKSNTCLDMMSSLRKCVLIRGYHNLQKFASYTKTDHENYLVKYKDPSSPLLVCTIKTGRPFTGEMYIKLGTKVSVLYFNIYYTIICHRIELLTFICNYHMVLLFFTELWSKMPDYSSTLYSSA